MKPRVLLRLLALYGVVLLLAGLAVDRWWALTPIPAVVLGTEYRGGRRVGRRIDGPGVQEIALAEGPLSARPVLFAFGLVPGRDGVRAELDGKTAWATVDDLYVHGAYDHAFTLGDASLGVGTHLETVIALLAADLEASPRDVRERAVLRRVRFARPAAASAPAPMRAGVGGPDAAEVRGRLALVAVHLARLVGPDGRFRYLVDAPTNRTVSGYNWPRHAGATYFLAQAAATLDDATVRYAALRAAARLRDELRDCGAERCIAGEAPIADLGASALALIAFAELVRTGADGAYRPAVLALASFLRSQQREDGELRHFYDRWQGMPLDRPALYYTGEAALALGRAHAISGEPRDLEASRRALAWLAADWSFFGSRYFYGEEHWTCQTVAELWDRAPDPAARDFCARWVAYQRRLQQGPDESPFDGDGAFNVGPIVPPRLTPAATRGEAAAALLDVLDREHAAGRAAADLGAVEEEVSRALAFLLRHQLVAFPPDIFADPVAVRGGVPGSPVDPVLRIDYAQHAGSLMIRWLERAARETRPTE